VLLYFSKFTLNKSQNMN